MGKWQIFFEFGKISPETREYYDRSENTYAQSPDEKAAHTLIYLDVEHQLVGIQPNFNLAPQAATIADNLGNAMTSNLAEKGVSVTLGPVCDPAKFEQQLRDAYAVRSFSITYTLPNDNLVPGDLYDTLTKVTEASGSEESKITTKAHDDVKNRTQLTQFARNANTGGFSASARVCLEEGAAPKTIGLGKIGGTVWFTPEEIDKGDFVFQRIRSFFESVKSDNPDLPQDQEENLPENQDQE